MDIKEIEDKFDAYEKRIRTLEDKELSIRWMIAGASAIIAIVFDIFIRH